MDDLVTLCERRIAQGSRSFATAARLFDPERRGHAYMLYAWCRYCDDAIDGQEMGFAAGEGDGATTAGRPPIKAVLAKLTEDTQAALAGRATLPEFVALQRVVAACDIPHRHPMELIEGFAMDAEGRRYGTLNDTLEYCYHVAGVVGVMMARVMGVRDVRVLERAQDLGIAFQLTNIARDVMDDWRAGRVYLPEEMLALEDIPRADLGSAVHRQAVARVVGRLLDHADAYYASARHGLPALPLRCAAAVAAASCVYGDIGTLVRRRGAAAWETRTVVGRGRKRLALARGLTMAAASRLPRVHAGEPRAPELWTKTGLGAS